MVLADPHLFVTQPVEVIDHLEITAQQQGGAGSRIALERGKKYPEARRLHQRIAVAHVTPLVGGSS